MFCSLVAQRKGRVSLPQSCRRPLTLTSSLPLFSIYTLYFSTPDIHQMIEASRTLVLLVKGATGGSASMIPDSTAPPKQKSMELNQQAKGLTLETSRAPAREQKYIHEQDRCGFPRVPNKALAFLQVLRKPGNTLQSLLLNAYNNKH